MIAQDRQLELDRAANIATMLAIIIDRELEGDGEMNMDILRGAADALDMLGDDLDQLSLSQFHHRQ